MSVRITGKPISPLRRCMIEDMTIRNLSPMTLRLDRCISCADHPNG